MTGSAVPGRAGLIEQFAQDPARSGRAMREALDSDAEAYAGTIVRDSEHDARDRGFRYALILLRERGLLVPALANPSVTSFAQALKITRVMLEIESNFANTMLEAAIHLNDLHGNVFRLRILDLIAPVSAHVTNWRSITQLYEQAEGPVKSRCARLLTRIHFQKDRFELRFEEGDDRSRADLLEGLCETDAAGTSGLLEKALASSNNRVAGNACLALYRAGDSRSLKHLAGMIESTRPQFRVTAAWVMGELRDARFIPLLREAARAGDPGLRRVSIRALSNLQRTDGAGTTKQIIPVFASVPLATRGGDDFNELWIGVVRPDGTFVEGLKSIDFLVSGPESAVLDYSVARIAGAGEVSVRIVWPSGHRALCDALIRSVDVRPQAQTWVLSSYSPSAAATTEAPVQCFSQDPVALQAELGGLQRVTGSALQSCRNLLGIASGARDQHLVLFADAAMPDADLALLRSDCLARGIALHCFPAGQTSGLDVDRIWSGLIASFRERYVIRTTPGEPVLSVTIRDAGRNPVLLSEPLILPAGVARG